MRNEVIIAGDSYDDVRILNANAFMVQSIDGDELRYNTLDARLELGGDKGTKFIPKGSTGMRTIDNLLFTVLPYFRVTIFDITKYSYGAPVLLKRDGKLIGKFYMDTLTRVGATQYQIDCVSAIGLLDKSQHYGGVYANRVDPSSGAIIQRAPTVKQLIEEVVGPSGKLISYSVDSEFDDVLMYGWLPVATRRENLHQILFAIGAYVATDAAGNAFFTPFRSNAPSIIPDDRVYMSGRVQYAEAVTQVAVHEHSFAISATGELTTLFDGIIPDEQITTPSGAIARGSIVVFNEPCDKDSLVASGCDITERGVNYAVLSPSAQATLTGRKYVHTIRQVNRPDISKARQASVDNKITVTNATLVSFANSELVADRVYNYYTSAKRVNADIVVNDEQPGDAVTMTDAFGDKTSGLIRSMDMHLSNTLKANVDVIADYVPPTPGNLYDNVAVITKDGTFTVPADTTKMRVILIGGGSGGSSGCQGQPNSTYATTLNRGPYRLNGTGPGGYNEYWYEVGPTASGKGGKGGKGGLGGKVLPITINVIPGQQFAVKLGKGGVGGKCTGLESTPGAPGTASTFGDRSSDEGSTTPAGYFDAKTGQTFAGIGLVGISGGDGVNGDSKFETNSFWGDTMLVPVITVPEPLEYNGVTYTAGQAQAQEEATTREFGRRPWEQGGRGAYYNERGLGGGAAVGANGPSTTKTSRQGATGATPIAREPVQGYGTGGPGGHGGGGAGGNGAGATTRAIGDGYTPQSAPDMKAVPQQVGGMGGDGGNGAPGCVIIYY